jgi:hypothetical protein
MLIIDIKNTNETGSTVLIVFEAHVLIVLYSSCFKILV